MQQVIEFLDNTKTVADPTGCLNLYQEGCALMASLGERVAKAEQSVAVLESSFCVKETAAKAQVLAKGTQEYYEYRTMKAQFSALDSSLKGLRNKAQYLISEFSHIKQEPYGYSFWNRY